MLSDSESQAPISPLHLAVSLRILSALGSLYLCYVDSLYIAIFDLVYFQPTLIKCVCLPFNQAYHGHCGALEVLLSSLLDVDVRSPEGRTPLSLACSRGHQECVSLLLHHGASPMTRDYTHKKTAIHAAGTHMMCVYITQTHIIVLLNTQSHEWVLLCGFKKRKSVVLIM